ncbi:MAG: hypothetical protein ACYS1A_04935 [Planctomycetota bacterium]|jgi:hypothetical protein
MINRLSNLVYWLIAIMVITAGCQRQYEEDVPVLIPLNDPNSVVPAYVSNVIKAVGGQRAWIEVQDIGLDCVVTFYKPDGSFYLTEHGYLVRPWANSIWVSATEPQYRFLWQLSDGRFSIWEGAENADPLPVAISQRHFTEMILNITTAPARFLDSKAEFKSPLHPVKIRGQWYHPYERVSIVSDADTENYIAPCWSKVVFYQNRDNSLVDMIWFAAADKEKFFAVRGYDYRKAQKRRSILVPARIEIFKTDSAGTILERLVKIDLK